MNKKRDKVMETNILTNMEKYTKVICVVAMLLGMSVNVWGANSSFDVSSITVNSVAWGTSTTSLSKYIGYDGGSIVTSATKTVWFQLYLGDEFEENSLLAFIEDATDGLGISMTVADVNPAEYYGYIGYVDNSGYNLPYHSSIEVDLQYVITAPRTSHTATLKFKTYSDKDLVDVLSIPITINMTGGYTITTAVSPAATGSFTAKVNGSARTSVKSDEQLDLVATPESGYMFTGWSASDGSKILFDNEEAASTFAYLSGNQTITANFDVACTSHTITLSGTPAGTGTNGTFSADKSSACEDATVTLTATPSSGYELDEWTVNKAGEGTCTVSSDQFTMPDENVTVSATFKAATYIMSFNANGGSGTMSPVNRVYNSTVAIPANTFTAPAGKVFDGWATSLGGDKVYEPGADYTMGAGDATLYAHWRDGVISDAKFSCADWSLTGPSGDIVFITSAANKTVRSQEVFHVSGNGLPHSTALTITTFPVNTKFEFKKADGTIPQTNEFGVVDEDVYAFYTPDAGDTSDGLDELASLTVSVTGEPRTATIDTKHIIGRHLPADFVIAAKYNKKWYAMPADMTTGTPSPVEIAVDDADNPTTAYTATGNMYSLYDQAGGSGVKLAMQGQSNAPLAASSSNSIGKSSATIVTNPQADNYLWLFAQTNSEITTAATAKYTMKSVSPYNDYFVRLKENAGNPKWGQYDAGITEIRLIPAIAKNVVEAYFIEYGQHGGIIEVDKVGMGAYYVKAKLNGKESPLTEFNQTLTSVLDGSTKYNYTVNFGDGINFADADAVGKILTLEWYDDAENMVGVTTIELPKIIIASDATMTTISSSKRFWENLEVHVLPGATLTANVNSTYSYNVTIKDLQIYPGAKVYVSTGTLDVTNLSLRNGWTRAGSKNYGAGKMVIDGSANLTHTNAYMDLYIDNDQYYPLAVPFPVTIEDIKYVYSTRAFTVGGSTGQIRLRYYDGAGRAAGNPFNWKFYGATDCLGVPETLEPSKGYAIAVKRPTGKAFSVIRLPLTFADAWTTGGEHGSVEIEGMTYTKNTVHVNAYGDERTKEADKGWNLIGNPYMGVFNGNDEEDFSGHLLAVKNKDNPEGEKIRYVTMPNTSFTDYTQVNVTEANMQPYSSFLIQAKEDCDLVFNTSKIKPSLAPAQFRATPTRMSEQEAYIRLSNENGSDQMGLIIGEDYTAEYETNADLAKMHGELNTLKTYMVYDETDMAYVAINEELAKEWIPVSVRIPADGEYTFSLRNISVINELEGIYLNDSYTNAVINLIEQDYTFIAEAGTITERFSINAIAGHRDTPTEIDVLNAGGDIHGDKPVKFIWNDKVFIWLNGAIYDTTGKRVK